VTASRQSQLLYTLDNVVDAIQTAAVEHRLLSSSGEVSDVREVSRTWEPIVCREGEVRDEDDLSACCMLIISIAYLGDQIQHSAISDWPYLGAAAF